jgi:hypothetical protein
VRRFNEWGKNPAVLLISASSMMMWAAAPGSVASAEVYFVTSSFFIDIDASYDVKALVLGGAAGGNSCNITFLGGMRYVMRENSCSMLIKSLLRFVQKLLKLSCLVLPVHFYKPLVCTLYNLHLGVEVFGETQETTQETPFQILQMAGNSVPLRTAPTFVDGDATWR